MAALRPPFRQWTLIMLAGLACIGLAAAAPRPVPAASAATWTLDTLSTLGTGWTYQGTLVIGGEVYNGTCDFVWELWDAAAAGSQVGSTQYSLNVSVSGGLFNAVVDFGEVYGDTALWLDRAYRCPAGSGAYTAAGRHPLSPTPLALYASSAGHATTADDAIWADSAGTAQYADSAGHATTADNAETASTADTAGSAGYAESSAYAVTAGYAITASNAITYSLDHADYGFTNRVSTTIGFAGTTFTLSDAGAGWDYYRAGVRYHITGNKTATVTAGMNYIYLDSTDGSLGVSAVSWTLEDTKVPVGTVAYNAGLSPTYWLADERHSMLIPRRVHWHEHLIEGTDLYSAGTLDGPVVAPNTPANTDNVLGIGETIIFDEDISHTLAMLAKPNGTANAYNVMYRTAASAWAWIASSMPYTYGTYIRYDSGGSLTEASANKWVNSYLCYTNQNGAQRYMILPGRAQYDSQATALTEQPSTWTMTGITADEYIIAYRLTWQTNASYGTAGRARLATAPTAVGLSRSGQVVSSSSIDHNVLNNLQGGQTGEYYHLTASQASTVVTGTGSPSLLAVWGDTRTLTATPAITVSTAGLTATGQLVLPTTGSTGGVLLGGEPVWRDAALTLRTSARWQAASSEVLTDTGLGGWYLRTSAGVLRWIMRGSGTETGGNAGYNLVFVPRDDAGNALADALTIVRGTGSVLLGATVVPSGATRSLVIANGTAPTVSVSNAATLYAADVFSSTDSGVHIRAENGSVYKFGGLTMTVPADLYVQGTASVQALVDRTPWYLQAALDAIRPITGTAAGIDHTSLPAFARKDVLKRLALYSSVVVTDSTGVTSTVQTITGYTDTIEPGRDIGAMVTLLTLAVQQLERQSLDISAVPAHNNSACRRGDVSADANYFYVCIANATWKRIAFTAGAW